MSYPGHIDDVEPYGVQQVHETRFAALLVHYLFREGFSMRRYAGEKRLDDITQGRQESLRDMWQARRARRIHFVMYGEQDTRWAHGEVFGRASLGKLTGCISAGFREGLERCIQTFGTKREWNGFDTR